MIKNYAKNIVYVCEVSFPCGQYFWRKGPYLAVYEKLATSSRKNYFHFEKAITFLISNTEWTGVYNIMMKGQEKRGIKGLGVLDDFPNGVSLPKDFYGADSSVTVGSIYFIFYTVYLHIVDFQNQILVSYFF